MVFNYNRLEFISTFSLFSLSSFFLIPIYFPIPFLIWAHFFPLSFQLSYPQSDSQGYFLSSLLGSSPPYLEIGLLGMFLLFKFSQMYLMRQRLGEGPFINAKVMIFTILPI